MMHSGYCQGSRYRLEIEKLVLGAFGVNCYILQLDSANIIIDPGADFNIIKRFFDDKNARPDMILNTHGHYDHIGAVPELVDEYGIPFYIHEAEEEIITDPAKNCSSFIDGNELSLKSYNLISSKDIDIFAGMGVEIIHTPGHTPGSIIIAAGSSLFSGDLLFNGGIGRTDLPGGNASDIKRSLGGLKKLDGSLAVYPGHGENTVLKEEFENNYYLQGGFLQ